jgi:hypothetical protein
MLNQQEITMEAEVAEDNRVGVMQQPVMVATAERKELVDEVGRISHEDAVDAHGTMIKQVKTLIKLDLVVPEVLELEVQEGEEIEADQEVEIEEAAKSQEVEEDEAGVDLETMPKHKKLRMYQTKRRVKAISAANRKP